MKLHLFQEIVELNQSFDRLMVCLKRLESIPFFQRDLVRHALSDVEIARVYPTTTTPNPRYKRRYLTLRIPQTVLQRVHNRLAARPTHL
jgi:hypothetical protein